MRRKGFTLIELLVVIAIIALLVGILVPSLKRANELARRAVCASQVHSIIIGCTNYALDNAGFIPPFRNYDAGDIDDGHRLVYNGVYSFKRNWLSIVYLGYVGSQFIFNCPSGPWSKRDPDAVASRPENAFDWYWSVQHVPYHYYGGPNRWLQTALPKEVPFDPAIYARIFRIGDMSSSIPLLTDMISDVGNPHASFYETNHFSYDPQGGNVGFGDCHVVWRDYDDMYIVGQFYYRY